MLSEPHFGQAARVLPPSLNVVRQARQRCLSVDTRAYNATRLVLSITAPPVRPNPAAPPHSPARSKSTHAATNRRNPSHPSLATRDVHSFGTRNTRLAS